MLDQLKISDISLKPFFFYKKKNLIKFKQY